MFAACLVSSTVNSKWCSINWIAWIVHKIHPHGVKWNGTGCWGKPKHWIWRRQNLNVIYVCEIGYNGLVFVFALIQFGWVGCRMVPMLDIGAGAQIPSNTNTIFIVQKLAGSLFYFPFEWHFEFNVNAASTSWLNDSKAYFIVLTVLSNEWIVQWITFITCRIAVGSFIHWMVPYNQSFPRMGNDFSGWGNFKCVYSRERRCFWL